MAAPAGNIEKARGAGEILAASSGHASDHEAPKGLSLPGCPGPAGLGIPCALEFSHPGDHVPAGTAQGEVLVAVRALVAERDELRRLLAVALPLLADSKQNRGAFLRRGVIAQIETAVRA